MSQYCMPCMKLYKVPVIEGEQPNPCVVYKKEDFLDPGDLSESGENRLSPVEKGFHDRAVKH